MNAEQSPGLHAFIHDAKGFALYDRSIIAKAPLQIMFYLQLRAREEYNFKDNFKSQVPD